MKIKRFIFLGAIMMIFAVFFAACDCSSLTAEKIDPSLKLELKDNVYHVTEITDKSITKIELPLTYRGKPVSVYEKNIFFECKDLAEIHFKGSLADWCALTFESRFSNPMCYGAEFFYGDNQTIGETLTVPDGVKKIGDYAFISRSSLLEVIIPRSVTTIGAESISYNDNLFSVNLPSSIETMDENYITECNYLMTINFEGTLADWCRVGHVPVSYSYIYLYVGGELVTGDIVIPEGVEKISSYAFNFRDDITSVTFPSTLRVIEHSAFRRNSSLRTVTLPAGLETVESAAFINCSALKSAYIPASVKEMGVMIFSQSDNKKITTVYCETLIKPHDWTDESDGWDNGCKEVVWGYNNISDGRFDYVRHGDDIYITNFKGSGDVIIPEQIDGGTVVSFGMTFKESPQITSVSIPDTVTDIFPYAFYGCRYLETVSVSDSVEKIEKYAFASCEKLSSFTFGKSVTEIGEEAFSDCQKLETVYYGGSLSDWCNITFASLNSQPVAASARWDNSLNESVTSDVYMDGALIEGPLEIPENISRIPDYAFSFFCSVTSLTVPESVNHIGKEAFYECSKLLSADILGGKTIDSQTFRYCSSLERVNLAGVAETNYAAFQDCRQLKTIDFSDNLKIIKRDSFKSIPIEELILPDSVEKIENGAFGYNSKLKTVRLPSSAEVGMDAFYPGTDAVFYCSSPEKPDAWYFMEKDTVVIYNVKDFGTEGDYSYITFNDGTARLTEYFGETELDELVVPDKIDGCFVTDFGSIYQYCHTDKFIINDYVTELKKYAVPETAYITVVGRSVKTIAADAFGYCVGLNRLYLPLNVEVIEGIHFTEDPIVVYAEAPSKPAGWNINEAYLYYCWNVKEVKTDDKYEYALLNDGTVELVKIFGDEETVIIPDYIDGKPVTALGNVFYERNVTHLVIGENVKKISNFIFNWTLDDLKTVEFKNPRGWQVSKTADFAEPAGVPENLLKTPELAASLFMENYYFRFWRRT